MKILLLVLGLLLPIWALDFESVEAPPEASDTLSIDALDSIAKSKDSLAADTVEYLAEELEYSFPQQRFDLKGKARLNYGSSKLTADTISYSMEDKTVEATGGPTISDKNSPSISGYKMRYNIEKKNGQIFYGSSTDKGQHFNGMDIRRLADGRLMIARGDFCACSSEKNPNYFFYSRRMLVEPDESVVAAPVVLNIAEVPVAVLPLLVYPLKSGRRSGLLVPNFGGDQSQGFYLRDVGYYWAINEYMDWDIRVDIVEGANATFDRNSGGSKFRYKKLYELDGSVDGKVYIDNSGTGQSGWDLKLAHTQNLTPDRRMTLTGEGSFVSSSTVRQSNGLDNETVLNQQANAQLTFRKQWKNNSTFTASTSRQENLTPIEKEGGYKERSYTTTLPHLQYSISGPILPPSEEQELDTLFEPSWYNKINYSFGTEANRFSRVTEREHSIFASDTLDSTWVGSTDRYRLDYSGTLFDVINIRPEVNFQNYWSDQYWSSKDTSSRHIIHGIDGGKNHFYKYSTSINTSTKLYGIWKPELGRFTGIRHTITPSLGYTYADSIAADSLFVPHPNLHPSSTRQTKRQTISMGLANDFDLKYISSYLEDNGENKPKYENLKLLNLTSNTAYNFAAIDTNGHDSLAWSPIASSIGLQLTPNYRFVINTRHSVYRPFSEDSLAKTNTVNSPQLQEWSFNFSRSLSWNGKFNSGLQSKKGIYPMNPWSASISYDYRFRSFKISESQSSLDDDRNLLQNIFIPDGAFENDIKHSSSARFSIHPTPNWKMSYSTHYNFEKGEFAEHRFTFDRTLGCWKMNFQWTPVGPSEGWSFKVYIIDLPDIKLESGDSKRLSNRS